MSRFFYFKTTFLSIAAGLFVGMLVYGLFTVDLSDGHALKNLVFKSLGTSILTALLLGLLNMIFKIKIGNFKKKGRL